ncbi:hypothetical protein GCM10022221_37200 [Actinocorallia aurea]
MAQVGHLALPESLRGHDGPAMLNPAPKIPPSDRAPRAPGAPLRASREDCTPEQNNQPFEPIVTAATR